MFSSSSSIAARIKQQAQAYAPQAKEVELDRLRQEHGLLQAQHKATVEKNTELTQRLALYLHGLDVALDFIAKSGVEITEDVAGVIAQQEELRIVRRIRSDLTRGKP